MLRVEPEKYSIGNHHLNWIMMKFIHNYKCGYVNRLICKPSFFSTSVRTVGGLPWVLLCKSIVLLSCNNFIEGPFLPASH